MKSNRFRKIIFITLGILGILFISYPFYYAFSPEITNFFSRQEFNSEEWKNWNEEEKSLCLRWDMTHDLIKKHDLIGLSIEEIIDLIGDPDYRNKKELSYYLGMSRHGIDTGSLILIIENDFVIDYKIWHG